MKKLSLVMAIVLALSFALTACQRSASQAPLSTPVAGGSPAVPTAIGGGGTGDPMRMLQAYATQTAMFTTVQPGTPSAQANQTPGPGGTALTPAVSPTATSVVPPTGVPGTPGTPTARVTAAPPTPGRPATWTLMLGEYPYCIARRFNVDPNELLTLNGLGSGQFYYPGMVLKIPQTGNPFPAPRALHPHQTTYNVLVDDTIYKIACYFGDVDPLVIASVNSLVAPYTLRVGQNLNIP